MCALASSLFPQLSIKMEVGVLFNVCMCVCPLHTWPSVCVRYKYSSVSSSYIQPPSVSVNSCQTNCLQREFMKATMTTTHYSECPASAPFNLPLRSFVFMIGGIRSVKVLGGWFVLNGIHMNTRIQGLPTEHCIIMRRPMIPIQQWCRCCVWWLYVTSEE